MTQVVTSPVLTPRPATPQATSEMPNALAVLRQYRWLVVGGAILGIVVGTATYLGIRRYNSRYAAEASFQVLAENRGIIDDKGPASISVDELIRFMRRQFLVITREDVMTDALKAEAFQHAPNDPKRQSRWLQEHWQTPAQDLQKDLELSPVPSTDTFSIRLVGSDANEVAAQVNAISDTYLIKLHQMELQDMSQEQKDADNARRELEERVKQKTQELDRYRVDHDVPGMVEQHTIVLQTLSQLNSNVVEAEVRAKQAKDRYDGVKTQLDNHTLQLPKEIELNWVDGDPTMRNLVAYNMQLLQEKSVSARTYGEQHRNTLLLESRIAEVAKQIAKTREELVNVSRQRMVENASSEASSAQGDLENKRNRYEEEQRKVSDLDRAVTRYNSLQRELDTEIDHLKKVTEKQWSIDVRKLSDASRVRQFQRATPNYVCIFPQPKVFLPGGLFLGAALAYAVGFLIELTNTRIRTPRDLTRSIQAPLLGFVPDQDDDDLLKGDLNTCIRTSPSSMIAESFRQIRGSLSAQIQGKSVRTILVASLSPEGGATTLASNLANGMALNDRRILLVDANFYRPNLKSIYPNIPAVGLSEVITGQATLEQAIVAVADLPTLHVMGTGVKPLRAPAEQLETKAFAEILATLRDRYDIVIFDGAPISLVSDSICLATKVDGVVAVVRAGTISRGTMQRVREQLRQVNANLLGLVLNAAQTMGSGYFKQNYRTFYQYAAANPRETAPAAKANNN